MTIRVTPLASAEVEALGWADLVISLLDIKMREHESIPVVDCPHLILRFDDTDNDPRFKDFGIAPKENQIRMALALVQPDQNILVHCHGGVCRSPALAFAILVKLGHSFEDAIVLIDNASKANSQFCMWPNVHVIELADKILNQDGKMIAFIQEWKKNAPSILSLMDKE